MAMVVGARPSSASQSSPPSWLSICRLALRRTCTVMAWQSAGTVKSRLKVRQGWEGSIISVRAGSDLHLWPSTSRYGRWSVVSDRLFH